MGHSYLLVSAQSPVTAQFSWELPLLIRGGKAQDWGTGWGLGETSVSTGLGASLEGEEELFGERKKEVDIWEANAWWLKGVWGGETKRR